MTRYHPALVALHWIMAILIFLALSAGKLVLEDMDNADPNKVLALGPHMTIGILLGVLVLVRLAMRFGAVRPDPATAGSPLLDRIGVVTHWALYALILAMVLSGMTMARSAGLFPIVFGGSGEPLSADFDEIAARAVHGAASTLLLALIALHIAAALYHQFVRRDGLIGRMWFGRRRT
ncbi:cytochrome b [Rhodobacterales bacterium HKCCE3408]|nr:cytochrome b [Rhodobacterales bacterium HKCCE3408]